MKILRLPWLVSVAPRGAMADSLGTTAQFFLQTLHLLLSGLCVVERGSMEERGRMAKKKTPKG